MPYVTGPDSDTSLIDAFRRQVQAAVIKGTDPWPLLLLWDGQAGVTRDELIDLLKQETGETAEEALPGAVQRSPFA